MMDEIRLNLHLFDDPVAADPVVYNPGGGSNTNTTTGTVNSYTGVASTTTKMSATMKTFYDTALLENTRDKLYYQQLGRKYTLPSRHGKIVEWRKWKTLPDFNALTEGVIPVGQTLEMTAVNVTIAQYGDYVAISDMLELHAVDDTILGATEELGAAAAKTAEKLTRDVLAAGTNVVFPPVVEADGDFVYQPTSRTVLLQKLTATAGNKALISSDVINKAVTQLRKKGAPPYSGSKYVAVIHPSVAYDLRSDPAWIDAHKYAAPEEIFNGEIGELHGVRFVESTLAPVIQSSTNPAIYLVMIFGKDAFGVVDPAGAGMETIIKSRDMAGGPLNQFSTVGAKFSTATKILYPERMVTIECSSSFSSVDEANYTPAGE